jgi:hypothetical protein
MSGLEAYASERGGLPITLRNKKVEDQIRAIGAETGEGPSAVIARLIEAESERLRGEKERASRERLARMRAFRATLPRFSEEERRADWEDMEHMDDYLHRESE